MSLQRHFSAEVARAMSQGQIKNTRSRIDDVFSQIEIACTCGYFDMKFFNQDLSKEDVLYLEAQGYKVYYNDPCLWREISWKSD